MHIIVQSSSQWHSYCHSGKEIPSIHNVNISLQQMYNEVKAHWPHYIVEYSWKYPVMPVH